ncbi:SPFH domain-containing protein [Clostridium thermarum]|uniref:SPFH domain-containing protein n=1 Tax=Clostridium thermarum TaxID=1716543 RepID=UPI001120666C|nr:SPFH domain-containing protein [Clostridium thermarum]
MRKFLFWFSIVFFIAYIFCSYNVKIALPNQTVVIKQWDRPVRQVENGLAIKIPFIQKFEVVDTSMVMYSSKSSNTYTKDNKIFIMGPNIVFNIRDVNQMLLTVKNYIGATSRVEDVVYEISKNVFAKYNYSDIIKNCEVGDAETGTLKIEINPILSKIEEEITNLAQDKIKDYGLEIRRVIIPSIYLPEQNVEAIFTNITADRKRVADEIINDGIRQANDIRAEFQKQIKLLYNEAELYKSNTIAQGNEEAKNIYNSVYSTDVDFYQYYKTIKMWENVADSAGDNEITIQIPADSEIGKILMGN